MGPLDFSLFSLFLIIFQWWKNNGADTVQEIGIQFTSYFLQTFFPIILYLAHNSHKLLQNFPAKFTKYLPKHIKNIHKLLKNIKIFQKFSYYNFFKYDWNSPTFYIYKKLQDLKSVIG